LYFPSRIDAVNSVASSQPFVFSPAVVAAQPSSTPTSVDSWVGETRREISEIVREVAAAVRKPQSNQQFFAFLADRTLRAMAAEGVVVWSRKSNGSEEDPQPAWTALVRLGRMTDQSFTAPEHPVHFALLNDIALNGVPVVVPSTPGATVSDVPANPAEVPVAIVPIEVHPVEETPIEYLLEVFIEPDGGVATQRGYLRFVAQMADLAAEYLRGDEIRRLKHRQSVQRKLDTILSRMHSTDDSGEVAAILVDGIAEVVSLDRVGLCFSTSKRAQLIAVSFVGSIAQNSPAAEQIREAAEQGIDRSRVLPLATSVSADDVSPDNLSVVWVAQPQEKSKLRLVCLACDPHRELSESVREDIQHCLNHANVALSNAARWKVVPGVRSLSSFLVGDGYSIGKKRGPVRLAFAIGLAAVAMLIAFLPVPLTVVAAGTLRPSVLDNFCAVRSAVVETVHVEHGQSVVAGDPLVTLHDDELEQQITTLLGRRAVLVEQQSRWTQALVDTATHRLDRTGQLQNERDLVAEELRGIDQQLALLNEIRQSLVLRAEKDGVVDAWQLRQRLSGRPLHRGDYLLSVIGRDTSWVVDAKIPQNRVSSLQRAGQEDSLEVFVTPQTDRAIAWAARMVQVGPGASTDPNEKPTNAVLMSLDDSASIEAQSQLSSGPLNGSPVQVVCRCGRVPLAYALLQDAIVAIRSNYRLYLGSPSQPAVSTSSSSLAMGDV
jgi:HlyD family secretion protein